ncbi:MAG: F0F1 ATP synthase subunit gamma [Gammaproteobacteria bacterium]|nr:F0F1 ATP synthase subunit gamma [Gammaproteobacteria bacterium]TVQ47802.1 MAG: F0F1 ATP synthase subunit gamma [Gammaproteobacteria bacterium]
MSGTKEIRGKIKSVKNTQKITKAMEMVAASKMRKAQDRMEAGRPYAQRIQRVIGHLMEVDPDYTHPYLVRREARRVGYVIVSTDRGLAGGLNVNLFRRLVPEIKGWADQGIEVELCLIGAKAVAFFRRLDVNIVAATTHLGETPGMADLIGAMRVMLDGYTEGRLDRLFLAHNVFVNTMSQKPEINTVLPVDIADREELPKYWDYIYEPSPEALLDTILERYIESQIYRAVVENGACEQAARMVAMKSATDNAGDLIGRLQLQYNKARQAAITKELAEIVGGAAAV